MHIQLWSLITATKICGEIKLIITDFKSIDFTRYNRVFAFGCSFTQYRWPTWADIMGEQCKSAEFRNYGKSGAGNLFISTHISQIDRMLKFTDTDLVLVMWSTFLREDKYINKEWMTPGNIFTQDILPKDYVRKYADVRGYLIRDMGIIDNATANLEHNKAHVINLLSVPASYQSDHTADDVSDVIELYSPLIRKFPISMFEHFGKWRHGHTYYDNGQAHKTGGAMFQDYHPNTLDYFNYLKHLNFPFTAEVEKYAHDIKTLCDTYTSIEEFSFTPSRYMQQKIL